MDTALISAAIVAIVFFIILAIFAMVTLSSLSKLSKDTSFSISKIQQDINELKVKMIESLSVFDETAKKLEKTSQNIENEALGIFEMLKPFKHLLDELYFKVGSPLLQVATVVSATTKAVNTFTRFLSKK